jgi:hypothetical protein
MYRIKIKPTSPADSGGYFKKKFFFKASAQKFALRAWELDPAGAIFIVEKIKKGD